MEKESNKDFIVIGFALFAMFFGAGNLIFPPSIGITAGDSWGASMIGFFLTGIGMPLLGILAVAISGGSIHSLVGKVGPRFGKIFGSLVIILIGPLVAIPRTGATAFEMGLNPNFPGINPIIGSVLFFSISLFLVIKPTGIVDRIGKILTPILLVMLSVTILKGILSPMGIPIDTGVTRSFSGGFTQGYQTMDLLGAIVFGSIVINSIKEKGYTKEKEQFKITAKAGLIAAFGLCIVYGGLLYLGATSSSVLPTDIEKTSLIVTIASSLLGNLGKVILGICVYCACLTTSVGLTATVGDYFSKLTDGKLSYRSIVIVTTLLSALISNIGVEKIVRFAGPVLTVIYPVAIVLVIINVFDNLIENKKVYLGAVLGTLGVSLIDGMSSVGVDTSFAGEFIKSLPLSSYGFAWLLPAILGFIIADILVKVKEKSIA
ncbi:MAG: branched-chain amino acid transport system II carrier protein [Firmicutes bacterium]|nr:branched-chain amino acid transport system II carrier protein [Bacillota bacterium]